MAFDMPTNVGPTYEMYVGPMSYRRCMSNMSYVGATLRRHVGPTMAQRANLRWANVVCQRWANGVANQNTPLAQPYHAIWETNFLHLTSAQFDYILKSMYISLLLVMPVSVTCGTVDINLRFWSNSCSFCLINNRVNVLKSEHLF